MLNQKLITQFKDSLWGDRLKFTPQRLAVLEEVINNESHRECEEIYLALKKRGSNVSRATVYRTMDILVKNGFARKISQPSLFRFICVTIGCASWNVNSSLRSRVAHARSACDYCAMKQATHMLTLIVCNVAVNGSSTSGSPPRNTRIHIGHVSTAGHS